MIFAKMSSRHKALYIVSKASVGLALGAMIPISLSAANVALPTVEMQISVGVGFVGVIAVFILAMLNRISALFKIKSMGFLVIFVIMLALKSSIDILVWSLGLMSIPLLIDDAIITPIWNNIWYKYYDD